MSEADTVAEIPLGVDPAVAVNCAETDPCGTCTLPGTESDAVDEESEMADPPAGAAVDRVMVQEVCAPEDIDDGEQVRFATDTMGCRATVVLELAAPRVAVTSTL